MPLCKSITCPSYDKEEKKEKRDYNISWNEIPLLIGIMTIVGIGGLRGNGSQELKKINAETNPVDPLSIFCCCCV